jgi:hypothetical protein
MLLVPALNVRSARGPAYDSDALAYCRVSGATDRKAISDFVRGVKNLGLWNDMVCWPLRSTQNAGTGTTAYSLGGLGAFNGTLVNGPTWSADGIVVAANTRKITTSFNFTTGLASIYAVFNPDSGAQGAGDRFMSNDQSGSSNGIGFDDFQNAQFRRLGAQLGNFGTRTANTVTAMGFGFGSSNTWWAQNGTRTGLSNLTYNASPRTMCPVGCPDVNTALGTYAMSIVFDGLEISSSDISNFYALYKSTLGIGLQLP